MLQQRIPRYLFTVWCICSSMLAGSASEQSSIWVQYNVQPGIRYTGRVFADVPALSLPHCAVECSKEESCYSFNYLAGRCELLGTMVSGLTTVGGWTHGYDNTPVDHWTARSSGCYCDFNSSRSDCACCQNGGCHCHDGLHHKCVQCGYPMLCWRQTASGCQCYWQLDSYDCPCCEPGGCQCDPGTDHQQCVECGQSCDEA